jgi:hypothetical protein
VDRSIQATKVILPPNLEKVGRTGSTESAGLPLKIEYGANMRSAKFQF